MKPADSDVLPRRARPGLALPLAALVAASVLWGGAVTGTKYALGGFGPVTLLSIELVAATAVLWAALAVRGYRPPGCWWLPAVLGLLEPALAYLGDTFGLSLTSAVHGAVINGLESALVVVLAALTPPLSALANPSDLARLGIGPGDRVRVSSPRGELTLVAEGDSGVPKGVLVIEFNVSDPDQPADNAVASLIDASAVVNEVRLESL